MKPRGSQLFIYFFIFLKNHFYVTVFKRLSLPISVTRSKTPVYLKVNLIFITHVYSMLSLKFL